MKNSNNMAFFNRRYFADDVSGGKMVKMHLFCAMTLMVQTKLF